MTKKTATVVGFGIGGGIAAMVLERAGFDVRAYEARKQHDFRSLHQLSLDWSSFAVLDELGIPESELVRYDSAPFIQEVSDGQHQMPDYRNYVADMPFRNVMWNDLHDALVERVTVHFDTRVTALPDTDVTVWADGVGSFGRETFMPGRAGTYGGEMVYRGFGDNSSNDLTWYMAKSYTAGYELVSYPCWDRMNNPKRGWTLMLKCATQDCIESDGTQVLNDFQVQQLLRTVRPIMHDRPFNLIMTSEETVGSPQLVWPMVNRTVFRKDGHLHYLLGDALGTVSPRTAKGANLAIGEAYELGETKPGLWQEDTVEDVNGWLAYSRALVLEAIKR